MKHRRKRPKHQRAGCLICKPWKDERGAEGGKVNEAPPRARRALYAPEPEYDTHDNGRPCCDIGACDCRLDDERALEYFEYRWPDMRLPLRGRLL